MRKEYAKGQNEYDRINNLITSYRYRLSLTGERTWLYLIEIEIYNLGVHLNTHKG